MQGITGIWQLTLQAQVLDDQGDVSGVLGGGRQLGDYEGLGDTDHPVGVVIPDGQILHQRRHTQQSNYRNVTIAHCIRCGTEANTTCLKIRLSLVASLQSDPKVQAIPSSCGTHTVHSWDAAREHLQAGAMTSRADGSSILFGCVS